MRRLATNLVWLLPLGVIALGGCNAVLGIDEAEPRGGTQQSESRLVPIATCDKPRTDSASCITTNCGQLLGSCLSQHGCRKALNDYRACLGDGCNKPTCMQVLHSGASALGECVQAECASSAGTSPIVEMCDLYCSCMQQKLPATAGAAAASKTCEDFNGQALLSWPIGDVARCKDACQKLDDLTSVTCRWTHCELATNGETAAHCQHAISADNCPLAQKLGECRDRKLGGFGCEASAECCSNVCSPTRICAD